MTWTRQQALELTKQILSHSKSPECEVAADLTQSAHTRFAANDVTTSGSARDLSITITSRDGKRSGTVRVNDTEAASLRQSVARSEELMRAATPDPEYVEALDVQEYPDITAYDEATFAAGADLRRKGVEAALKRARGSKLDASGFCETVTRWSALANKRGNFGFFRSTNASFSTTMRTNDGTGSGWAGQSAPRISTLAPAKLVERAATKAETSVNSKEIEPGRYTVILEPQAVADLVENIGFFARAADEGRSFLSNPDGGTRVGEKLFSEKMTLRSDPFDPRNPARPWAFGGLPQRKTTWVDKGVVKQLAVDRYWASRSKGTALPYSGGLILEGGSGTLEDLIAGTERGLLITRFWYIRMVNPQRLELTGLTRDGVWLVENGKIKHAVGNLRFNESPLSLLKNIDAMSESMPAGGMVVPAIRAKEFLFTSKSDAV